MGQGGGCGPLTSTMQAVSSRGAVHAPRLVAHRHASCMEAGQASLRHHAECAHTCTCLGAASSLRARPWPSRMRGAAHTSWAVHAPVIDRAAGPSDRAWPTSPLPPPQPTRHTSAPYTAAHRLSPHPTLQAPVQPRGRQECVQRVHQRPKPRPHELHQVAHAHRLREAPGAHRCGRAGSPVALP